MKTDNLVLVTGSAGRIGQAVVAELRQRGVPARGFDRVPTPGIEDFVLGDIASANDVRQAVQGTSTIIHLAATPDDADFLTELLTPNIIGVYLLLEAARVSGVRRLVLASSGQVNWWQREAGQLPVRVEDPPSPKYWYAAGKMFMESIGRGFAEMHDMSVIVARLGWCPRTPEHVRQIALSEIDQDVYFSPGDAGRFFACAAAAPDTVRFAIVYASSKPPHKAHFDLEPAERLLGYVPRDKWPEGVALPPED